MNDADCAENNCYVIFSNNVLCSLGKFTPQSELISLAFGKILDEKFNSKLFSKIMEILQK
ncbi:hypothetical protein EZS27_011739 [termite gut metagenome]|uniref:Uncharacterized protein n=1 Tax=termite gut metagenome TaxID=433724 RepID=A0A5J4S3P4_9ZZZZ